jgi:hypothetical protein
MGRMRSPRLIGCILAALVAVTACDSATSTTTPASTGTASPTPTSAATAGGQPSAVTGQASQTDTDWGPIWDALPRGFPVYQGSQADDAAAGPASAVLLAQTADAKGIATYFETALKADGYQTAGLSGPLEDGSYVLDMTGTPAGCEAQVSVAPTGGLTTITILYGAGCPTP